MKRKRKKLQKLIRAISKYFISWQKCNATLKKELSNLFILVTLFLCFISCNVKRIVTTESQYIQRGDTSCVITTKTIETYDATKKF